MGAELAATASNPAGMALSHFNDTIVVKLELKEGGKWVVMGRVILGNVDGDWQTGTAKLVHDANVVIDQADIWMQEGLRTCMYLQGGLVAEGNETITLECNTYDGSASWGSIVAFRVDDIWFQ